MICLVTPAGMHNSHTHTPVASARNRPAGALPRQRALDLVCAFADGVWTTPLQATTSSGWHRCACPRLCIGSSWQPDCKHQNAAVGSPWQDCWFARAGLQLVAPQCCPGLCMLLLVHHGNLTANTTMLPHFLLSLLNTVAAQTVTLLSFWSCEFNRRGLGV
jgi:hypothetical protein